MRLNYLVNQSRFPTAILEKDTLIVLSASSQFADRYGRTPAELIGTRFFAAPCEVQLFTADCRTKLAAAGTLRDCLNCYPCISKT